MTRTGKPRLGMLGVGWIGRNRMQSLLQSGLIDIAAIVDPSAEMAEAALQQAPNASRLPTLDAMLAEGVDGVVIATPSAMHADQTIQALQAGAAVFCQKPLGRSNAEVQSVIEAARTADRLLGVDFSYRFTQGMSRIRDCVQGGEIGQVFAVDLVFHNAYGPDKGWFYDRALSGGGCVMDLGVHLIDLCFWVLGTAKPSGIDAHLFVQGQPWRTAPDKTEDFAVATFNLDGAAVRLACSWNLSLGCDAMIGATFHGTGGGAIFRNVDGSFYDFTAELCHGTSRTQLAGPPDDWGGRAAVDWARQLADGKRSVTDYTGLLAVSSLVDDIYRQAA